MSRTHVVKFFIAEAEYELLLNNARIAGFNRAATFCRHMALDYTSVLEKNIVETKNIVKFMMEELRRGGLIATTAKMDGNTRSAKKRSDVGGE